MTIKELVRRVVLWSAVVGGLVWTVAAIAGGNKTDVAASGLFLLLSACAVCFGQAFSPQWQRVAKSWLGLAMLGAFLLFEVRYCRGVSPGRAMTLVLAGIAVTAAQFWCAVIGGSPLGSSRAGSVPMVRDGALWLSLLGCSAALVMAARHPPLTFWAWYLGAFAGAVAILLLISWHHQMVKEQPRHIDVW